jgi:inosine/xanthosine triphosphate pyrophosphatase family protein
MSTFIYTSNKGKLLEFQQILLGRGSIVGLKELQDIADNGNNEPIENSNFFLSNAFIKTFIATKYVLKNRLNPLFSSIDSIIIDDSGLCVPALGFIPGVHSATYAGNPKDDKKNRLKLAYEINKSPLSFEYRKEKRLPAFFVCFLFEIKLDGKTDLSFIHDFDFIEASTFVNRNIIDLERKLLNKVKMEEAGGFYSVSLPFSCFYNKFPNNIFVNVHYGFCNGEVSSIEQNLISGAGHGYDVQFYSKLNKELSFASIPMDEKNRQSHRAFAMEAFKKKNEYNNPTTVFK